MSKRPLWARSRLATAQRPQFEPRVVSGRSQDAGSSLTSIGWPAERTSSRRQRSLGELGLTGGLEPTADGYLAVVSADFPAGETLLHKRADGRGSPFPGQTYPTASVTGMPSAV